MAVRRLNPDNMGRFPKIANLMKNHRNTLRMFRILALLEAATLIVLVCIAVPLKHLAGYPTAVSVMGPIHGVAFVLYIWMLVNTAAGGIWSKAEVWRLAVAAFVPFGGLISARWIASRRT